MRLARPTLALLLLLGSALASAGSISGHVTRADNGAPLSLLVILYDLNLGEEELATVVSEPADGSYRFDDLPASDAYVVRLFDPSEFNLIGEVWENIICPFGCELTVGTPIVVGASDDVTGIDFTLDNGGEISGRVTRADDGTAVANMVVASYPRNQNGTLTGGPIAFTDADGFYTISGLPSGNYVIGLPQLHNEDVINADGLQPEVYDNVRCPCLFGDGDDVIVTAGAVAADIDFVLETAPFPVSGRVTDGAGRPLAGVRLEIIDRDISEFDELNTTVAGKAVTDADGRYAFQVDAGRYLVYTDSADQGLIDEYFDDVPRAAIAFEEAPVLEIDAPRSDINFELGSGARIEGRVTREDGGAAVPGFLVVADNLDDDSSYASETDAVGNYSIRGLTPGTYRVLTFSGPGFNLINETWDDIQCQPCGLTDGAPVIVALGQVVTGVDFALTTGGGIFGTVESVEGAPLASVLVVAFDENGMAAGQEFADGSGSYAIQGLVPGDYTVLTTRAGQFSLVNELFDDRPCVADCDPTTGRSITVPAGSPVQGIDFVLARVPVLQDGTPVALDELGEAVAVDGSLLAIGVPGDDEAGEDAGAVQLFERSASGFEFIEKVFADDAAPGDRFGSAVAIDGGLLVVGATGSASQAKGSGSLKQSAYLFQAGSGGADQLRQLVASNLANATSSGFGTSVAISGNLMVVGAPSGQKESADGAGEVSGTDSGAAVVFEIDGGNATQVGVLTDPAGASGDGFGTAVAVSGPTVAAGIPNKQTSGLSTGAAAVFERLGQNLFSAPMEATGTADGDAFGASLALDGVSMVVGAPGADTVAQEAGSAFVFAIDGDTLVQRAELVPIDPQTEEPLGRAGGLFGTSVSVQAGAIAIGAIGEDGAAAGSGAAYVYTRRDGASNWALGDRLVSDGGAAGDELGRAVSIDTGTVIVGAPRAEAQGVSGGIVLGASSQEFIFGNGFER
ncbi:MAG: carboxypeptidase regulatory-like domain-containing protein [Pseudomonadota bacterium]